MGRSPYFGKPIRCKAAVCRGSGEALQIEEVEVAPPKAFEVRIKIICTSLCFSDISFWRMKEPAGKFPRIFGHEAFGVVESVGENVKDFKEGDRVIPVFLPDCQECVDCKSEKSNMCSTRPFTLSASGMRDGTGRFTDSNGGVVHDFGNVSSFSQYTVVDIINLVKLDANISPEKACLFSCGATTGVGAAWKLGGVTPGSTVAIFGLGSIGYAVAAGARLQGASRIIGVDLNPEKFELGKKFGVTDFINSRDTGGKPVNEVIIEMTNGGADCCFECVGLASLMKDAFNSCRVGWGRTIILGVESRGTPISVDSAGIIHGRSLSGSLLGGIKAKSDIPVLLKRYVDKELHIDGLITHEVGFQDINKAFDLLLQGKSLRCIIWMDK